MLGVWPFVLEPYFLYKHNNSLYATSISVYMCSWFGNLVDLLNLSWYIGYFNMLPLLLFFFDILIGFYDIHGPIALPIFSLLHLLRGILCQPMHIQETERNLVPMLCMYYVVIYGALHFLSSWRRGYISC